MAGMSRRKLGRLATEVGMLGFAGALTRYPLRDAADAHRDLQARKTTGSVVLTP